MATIYEILGNNIRVLRKAKGWSQAKLAEKVELSVPYITMIELGQRSASLEVIQLIANAFSVSVSKLFEVDEEKKVSVNKDIDSSSNAFLGLEAAERVAPYLTKKVEAQLELRIKKLIQETLEDIKKNL